jgi:hypothetical protein
MKKGTLILIGMAFSLIILLTQLILREEIQPRDDNQIAQTNFENRPSASAKPPRRPTIERPVDLAEESRRLLQEEIISLLTSENPADINKVYNELVPKLTKMDPRAAAAFAQSPEAARWRHELMMGVAQSWATLNPDDAQEWASSLQSPSDNPTERDTMVSYVGFAIANTDLGRTVQLLEETSLNWDRQEIMVENLAQQWAEHDLQPLVKWLDKLPPGKERDTLFARIVNAQARIDPMAAGKIVSEKIAPGPIQQDAAAYVVQLWAWNDRQAATDWVNQFPPGDVRDRVSGELADTIARRDGAN